MYSNDTGVVLVQLVLINLVVLRRAQLVLGWVTICRWLLDWAVVFYVPANTV